jgi:hypothetical protein
LRGRLFGGLFLSFVGDMVAVMLGMQLTGLGGMMRRVRVMAMRDVSVMRGLFHIFVAMMCGGQAMMLRRRLVMLSCLFVMFGDCVAVRHDVSSLWRVWYP